LAIVLGESTCPVTKRFELDLGGDNSSLMPWVSDQPPKPYADLRRLVPAHTKLFYPLNLYY
jgi:hypothetical protein